MEERGMANSEKLFCDARIEPCVINYDFAAQ